MQENPQQFNEEDRDATLASPRFDASDARRAHPVVPLDEVRERRARGRVAPYARRPWLLTLLVISLLAVVAVAGIATKVLRRAPAADAATTSDPATQQAATSAEQAAPPVKQTDASTQQAAPPAQKVEPTAQKAAHTQAQAGAGPSQASTEPAQSEARAVTREEARARRETRAPRDARDERAGREEETAAPVQTSREDDGDSWGDGRHGRGRDWERRRRHEGEGDEGWRRDGRREGKKQARLVDVLTARPRP